MMVNMLLQVRRNLESVYFLNKKQTSVMENKCFIVHFMSFIMLITTMCGIWERLLAYASMLAFLGGGGGGGRKKVIKFQSHKFKQ